MANANFTPVQTVLTYVLFKTNVWKIIIFGMDKFVKKQIVITLPLNVIKTNVQKTIILFGMLKIKFVKLYPV